MKVLIPTAGVGSRLGDLTAHYNKALLPIGHRPVISYIIDWYPPGTEFVIALGYGGAHIREYLELAYPHTRFTFVEVDNFDGPGSGPGYTLRLCKPHLDEEFVFHANDTILVGRPPSWPLEADTMFLRKGASDPKRYRTVSLEADGRRVAQVHGKSEQRLQDAYDYVGVAFVKDHEAFRAHLDGISVQIGESDYFMKRAGDGVQARFVERWYDIGNIEQYRSALRDLARFNNLSKPDEAIYFHGPKVLKFSTNTEFISRRVRRAELLNGCVPQISTSTKHFFEYGYVPGDILAERPSVSVDFKELLEWCLHGLWQPIRLSQSEFHEFENTCFRFYYEKTMDRVDAFYSRYDCKDACETINGVLTPQLEEILESVDWSVLKRGTPVLFHGDLHLDNVVRTDNGFVLLDWRQDFGGELRYGDIYYDLAKLLHGLIINHDIIRNEQFTVEARLSEVAFDFHRKHLLIECEGILRGFVERQEFDWRKVATLAALIFLNIAALHHYPYSHLLYYLGKSMLWRQVSSADVPTGAALGGPVAAAARGNGNANQLQIAGAVQP